MGMSRGTLLGRCAHTSTVIVLVMAGMTAVPTSALAQTANPSEADSGSDIVVTANKRVQSLNDVGLTVSVLGAEQLADRRIVSLADVAAALPGLSYSSSEQNTPVFTLRGIGFNEASLAAYPTVSVYIDEAPLAFPVLTGQGAFDLERIEVLKGPQGTLFGQNSTGGAINYIAAKPTNSIAAGGDITYGRFNLFEANGFISGPITDRLKLRVAGHIVHSDDWQRSYTRKDGIGGGDVYAGRAIFDWEPSDEASFLLTVSAWQDKSDPQAGQLTGKFYQGTYPNANLVDYPYLDRYDNRTADWSYGQNFGPNNDLQDPTPFSNRKFGQAILRSTVNLGGGIDLTALTAYAGYKQRQAIDYDATSLAAADLPFVNGSIRTFSQEVRLSNDPKSKVRWVVGGNYQWSRIKDSAAITVFQASTFGPAFNFIYQNAFRSTQRRRDVAVFGNIEADIASQITVKAGARYTCPPSEPMAQI